MSQVMNTDKFLQRLQAFNDIQHLRRYQDGVRLSKGMRYLVKHARCDWLLDQLIIHLPPYHTRTHFTEIDFTVNGSDGRLVIKDCVDLYVAVDLPNIKFPLDHMPMNGIPFFDDWTIVTPHELLYG
jgi:hypothetical protein